MNEKLEMADIFINNLSKHHLRIVVARSNFGQTLNFIIYDIEGTAINVIVEPKSNESIYIPEANSEL